MTNAQLIALLRKHPIGFICGFISLVCAVALYFRSDLIADGQTEAEKQTAQAARALTNIKNATNLPEQLAQAQALTKEMEARLMRAGQLASNLQYFYKLETENEVKLIDLRQGVLPTGKAAAKGAYVGIPYNLSVQGTYAQVIQFIGRLEAGRHFCRFNSASFSKVNAGGGSASDAVTAVLSIELFGTP